MKIELRENETTTLIRAATGRVLALTFGSRARATHTRLQELSTIQEAGE